jgi:hypothetical protein
LLDIYCDRCGGFMNDPSRISYQVAPAIEPLPAPHSGLCLCLQPIIYGPPPGRSSSAGRQPPARRGTVLLRPRRPV